LDEEVGDIINNAIVLWKNDSKYRFLYANPSLYLNELNGLSLSNATCSIGTLDNDDSCGINIS